MMRHPVRQYLLLSKPPVYSVSFRDASLLPAGKREDMAVGKVAGTAIDGARVRNDFDHIPIFQRPICNATWDSARRRWCNFVWKGEEGFSWSPTEPKREVLYRCRPFYYKIDMSGDSAPAHISVSAMPLQGYRLAPMFRNGTDFVYRPCFAMGLDDEELPHSRAGLTPFRGGLMRTIKKTIEYDAAARIERMADWFSDLLLIWVEFATRDLASVMCGAAELYTVYKVFRRIEDSNTVLRISAADAANLDVRMSLDCKKGTVSRIADIVSFEETEDGNVMLSLDRPIELPELTFGEDGVSNSISSTVTPWRSGSILPFLNASSGVRSVRNGRHGPCAWRGKENAWGNSGSSLFDISLTRDGYDGPGFYHLTDLLSWDGRSDKLDSRWKKITDINTPQGALGYIKSFFKSAEVEGVMWPSALESEPTPEYAGTFLQHLGSSPALFVYVGAYRDSAAQNNPATIRSNTLKANNHPYSGSRLVLFEADD